MKTLYLACMMFVMGCQRTPVIQADSVSVVGNKNAGRPATLDSETTTSEMPIPEESVVTTTRTNATSTSPAVEMREVRVTKPTKIMDTTVHVRANTGTVDQSVAFRQVDNAERRILLYAAIGAALLGVLARAMLSQWPSISRSLLIAAVFFAGAWKFSEVPWWAGLIAVAIVGLVIAGYKRAEWDANGNGIPDIFEKNK